MRGGNGAEFDEVAGSYDRLLNESLAASGESREFFARGRVGWLAAEWEARRLSPAVRVLDFGCGTGGSTPWLRAAFSPLDFIGSDVSESSLEEARRMHGGEGVRFVNAAEMEAEAPVDLAFCNGVFHHIPPAARAGAVASVWRVLKPGGIFAFFENNPWNPGTLYVMSRCVFDRNAITLSPREARSLLEEAGFRILTRQSLFYFPRALGALRPLEKILRRLPFGAQYAVLGQKA